MIEVFFDGKKKVNARIEGFTILTDQAVGSGGDGSAPEPFMLFLASLATCGGIYVKSFCDQRGIPANGITLDMSYQYDPAARMIGTITFHIYVPADFPEKYDKAVINSVSLCAVKRHLSDKIRTEILVVRN
jgi:putative redox protein